MEKNRLPFIGDVKDLKGKYVFLRTSLNVPIEGGQVTNQFRLMRGLPTVQFLVKSGARVIMAGHISQSKDTEGTDSLQPVYKVLSKHLPITFSPEIATPKTKELRDGLKDGEVLLLENLRQDPREKKNDADFARCLADLADIYVNDAFAASHRSHASLVGVPEFLPSYFGHNFKHEFDELSKTINPQEPSIFILGGAKFDTKMPLVEKFLDVYDHIVIGGALANDLYRARGFEVGESLVSSDVDELSLKRLVDNKKIIIPETVVVSGPSGIKELKANEVAANEAIMDAGLTSVTGLAELISEAKTILWNGPLGNYEKGFATGTTKLAKLIAESQAYSVIGGGDTIAAIEELNCQEKFNFLSTAGGAMLTFLEQGSLPAIDAVLSNND